MIYVVVRVMCLNWLTGVTRVHVLFAAWCKKHKMAACQIPLTFTSAVVFCSPKMQLYSPTSSGWTFLMCISAVFPLSVIWYRPP